MTSEASRRTTLYAQRHPGYTSRNAKAFRAKNPNYGRDWLRAHPAFVAAKNADRRLALASATELVTPLVVFKRDRWICQICHHRVDSGLSGRHKVGPTLDHIVPLSKGGPHSYANSQLAHRSCNSSKGANLPVTLPSRKPRPTGLASPSH